MERKEAIKITPEIISALGTYAATLAGVGASIDEVMTAADKMRQTFLDLYAREAIKQLKP